MKNCPNCKAQAEDNAVFCTSCGAKFAPAQAQATPQQPQQTYQAQPPKTYYAPAPAYDPYDHTADFDANDIAENKLFALLAYLLGPIGVIIVLLMKNPSFYVAFHVRQSLKFTVVEVLSALVCGVLSILILPLIAYGIFSIVITVVKIITILQVCSGKAKDAAVIRSFSFLR